MSCVNINKPYKQCFKGIENFLRRVAFNLGNTPSQTEVKIISCIPIDVSDLQAKILFLERQLQESCKQQVISTKSRQSALVAPPSLNLPSEKDKARAVSNQEGAKDDKGGAAIGGNAKEATKEGTVSNKANKQTVDTVMNTVLYGGSYNRQSNSSLPSKSLWSIKSRNKPKNRNCYMPSVSNRKKSNVSVILSTSKTSGIDEHPSCITSSYENVDSDSALRNIAEAERKLAAVERYYNNLKNKRKRKFCKEKGKLKTQLVYFAQNREYNPFNANALDPFKKLTNTTKSISHAYLDNVIRKQYDPKFAFQEFSDTSHFSQPVCRDSETLTCFHMYESDKCSCCHERFQNIDKYLPKDYDFIHELTQCKPSLTNKTYYDSNMYDVVPVKDNTDAILRQGYLQKRDIEMKCWPEQFRSKHCRNQAESLSKRRDNVSDKIFKEKSEQCNIKQINNDHKIRKVNRNIYDTNYSDIYRNHNSISVKAKNELIETNLTLKNQSTQLEVIPDNNKTDPTLNEIKNILQSFLSEVKANTKISSVLKTTPKIDAVVQKGGSQKDLHEQSTLLHSFTYNHSYEATPYLSSCSRQVPVGPYCFPGIPYQTSLKYLQNFPVFVNHPPQRSLCTCCCKNNLHKCSKYKQASAAATNTGKIFEEKVKSAANQETEKLIKEIYKSVIAPVNFSTKNKSSSKSDAVKSVQNDLMNEENIQTARNTLTAVVDKRDIEIQAFVSRNVSNHSKASTRTQSDIVQIPEWPPEVMRTSNEINRDKTLNRFKQISSETITEYDVESEVASSNETEEETAKTKDIEPPPKHEKQSLLRRMLKIFKKRKAEQKIQNEAVPATSDSEYENSYSGKTNVHRPKECRQSYQSYIRSRDRNAFNRSVDVRGRSPYLEQEYRRQWNERLMFYKQQGRKCSSERPLSTQVPKEIHPIYWNNYEAKSVMVDNNLPKQLRYVKSKAKGSKFANYRE